MRLKNRSRRWSQTSFSMLSGTPRRLALALVLTTALLILATSALASFTFLLKWGTSGTGNGQFITPTGIATDSAGNVYASDVNNHRIQKFGSAGVFITKWGSNGGGDGQFLGPEGLAIDSSDNVYVADTGNNRIQKFTSTGGFITKWGTSGSGNGQF